MSWMPALLRRMAVQLFSAVVILSFRRGRTFSAFIRVTSGKLRPREGAIGLAKILRGTAEILCGKDPGHRRNQLNSKQCHPGLNYFSLRQRLRGCLALRCVYSKEAKQCKQDSRTTVPDSGDSFWGSLRGRYVAFSGTDIPRTPDIKLSICLPSLIFNSACMRLCACVFVHFSGAFLVQSLSMGPGSSLLG